MPQDVTVGTLKNGGNKGRAGVIPTVAAGETTVSATLVDLGGITWENALVTINFVPAPNIPGPYMWQGGTFSLRPQLTADSNGYFSITLPDNLTITPAGSMWQFVIAPAATMPAVVFQLMVAGASMDLSSVFTSQSYQVSLGIVQSLPLPRAYTDSDVATPPNTGQIYWNSTDQRIRVWGTRSDGTLGWSAPNDIQTIDVVSGNTLNMDDYRTTVTYAFVENGPTHGIPNPSDSTFQNTNLLLFVYNLRGTAIVNIGDPGYVIQMLHECNDVDQARWWKRRYSNYGPGATTIPFSWSQWARFKSTDEVPSVP